MKRHSRSGNLVIFLCLTMSAIILLLNIFIVAAGQRAAEHDLARAMSAQIRATLADFDAKCQQFGLFAFRADAADLNVFRDTLPPALRATSVELIKLDPLTQPATLEAQIIRHMKGRLPAIYLDNLIHRLLGLTTIKQQPMSQIEDSQASPESLTPAMSDENGESLERLLEQAFKDLAADQLQNAAKSLFGEAFDQIEDKLLAEIKENYRNFAIDTFGSISEQPISPGKDETRFLPDPADLTRLAGQVDQLLNFSTLPFYEKLCLVEYVLNPFNAEVHQYEVEQIITGLPDADQAFSRVKAWLCGIRSIFHLAWILTDQQKMNEMRAWAITLSGAILVATSGSTVIDPDPLTYILALGQAIGGALADCDVLARGESVPIWPGQSTINLDITYQDYLRVFLLVMPRATLVSRISQHLAKILPGDCYTRLAIKTRWRGVEYSLEGGYIRG